jgi:RNA-binding protein 39
MLTTLYCRSSPSSPPRRRRRHSPSYDPNGGRAADALLDEIDSEARSVCVSQLAAKLTSRDLGMFFEDKLGEGAVRDAKVVTDRISRRSKGSVRFLLAHRLKSFSDADLACSRA